MIFKILMSAVVLSVATHLNAVENFVWVYLGAYAKGEDQGITLCKLDRSSGKLEKVKVFGGHSNPAFLEVHPSQKFLYAANEMREFKNI